MDVVEAPETRTNAPKRPGLLGAFVAPAAVVLVVVASWATRSEPRPPLATVADFALTDQAGRTVTRRDLEGRPWIVDFVFTRCGGPCPRMTEGMAKLQTALTRTDARLVSFSVDPEHDTPAVLAEYAKAHGAGERWTFLTGDAAAIASLARGSFLSSMERDARAPVGESVSHSMHYFLVDRGGHVRGYYSPLDENRTLIEPELERLDHDLRALGNGSRLPLVNAALNATSALLLVLGYALIRAGRVGAHATAMLGALAVSTVFLGCYLYYHATYPSTPFAGEGVARAVYLAILIPHVLLAVPVVPLAIGSAVLGLRGRFERHRRWARWTFPLWIYVSVTGVAVYALLYEIHRP